jgi:SAM-dependent methyltransferase
MFTDELLELFKGKYGLEVGGPSRIFTRHNFLPIYPLADSIDGCNFSKNTLWEKNITPGKTYKYLEDKLGEQYICEATDLISQVDLGKYDFVISSNCLEHIANPIKALLQFKKVLKLKGLMVLVLPKKEVTFDHNREVTTYDHLCNDYVKNVDETDLTHLAEILKLHDLALDPPAGTLEQFTERSKDNFINRALHHHIFDGVLLTQLFDDLSIEKIYLVDNGAEYMIAGRKRK